MFKVLLRRYRLEAGLTQEALAARAGVSVRNIQELERGANNPLRDTMRRLVDALDLTADDRTRFDAATPPAPRRRVRAATHLAIGRGRLSADGLAPLSRPPTPFIGRAREVVLVREALRDGARLVTLTGVGGAGRKQVLWLDRLETELNNLRAALTWARDSGDVEVGLRLAGALYRFWDHHSHFAEGQMWLEAGLARGAGLPADVRAKALHVVGVLTLEQGAYDQAAAYLSDSLALFRGLGDLYGAAFALYALGTIALYRGEHERATAFLTEALELLREVRDTDGIAALLGQIGYAALLRRDYGCAIARFEESLALYQDMGSTLGSGYMLVCLGRALLEQGDYARAWAALTEGLRLTRQAGNWWYIAECLETMAAATAAGGEPMRAARLWGATEALRATLAAPLPPVERPLYERHIAAARAVSDDASFAAAWAEGQALTLERTLALTTAPNPALANGSSLYRCPLRRP